MSQHKQEQFRVKVKTRLLINDQSVADLARQIGRPRSSVSQAINQNRFPAIRNQVQEALGL